MRRNVSDLVNSEYEGHILLIVVDPTALTPQAFVIGYEDALRAQTHLNSAIVAAMSHPTVAAKAFDCAEGADLVNLTDHVALRPTWECRVCGGPWPCATAKTALRVEYRATPSALGIYLGQQWAEASMDLTGVPESPDLLPRFVGWRR